MEQAKHNQHYVWQHYLRAWVRDGEICCMDKSKTFCTGTSAIAMEKDIYKLRSMTYSDINFLEGVISRIVDPMLTRHAKGWLEDFLKALQLVKLIKSIPNPNEEILKALEVLETNFEDNIHTEHEKGSIEALHDLRECDDTLFADPERLYGLCVYLGSQYLRTPKMAAETFAIMKDRMSVDIKAVWGPMRIILGWNLAGSLLATHDKWQVEYLHTDGELEFIASDQPMINLVAVGQKKGIEPSELQLYYPITPDKAVIINPNKGHAGVTETTISKDKVQKLNQSLASFSHRHIFATSKVLFEGITLSEEDAT